MLGFVGRVVWGTGKLVVRHVVWPVVVTAITAAVLSKMAEKMNERTAAREGQPLLAR